MVPLYAMKHCWICLYSYRPRIEWPFQNSVDRALSYRRGATRCCFSCLRILGFWFVFSKLERGLRLKSGRFEPWSSSCRLFNYSSGARKDSICQLRCACMFSLYCGRSSLFGLVLYSFQHWECVAFWKHCWSGGTIRDSERRTKDFEERVMIAEDGLWPRVWKSYSCLPSVGVVYYKCARD